MDIFNIHASLLERGGKTKIYIIMVDLITCFPIIETINSDITEYIATNCISITDGQCYLKTSLYRSGIIPAVDSGLSVSRIGSSAQCKLMKVVSVGLKNETTILRSEIDLAISFSRLKALNYYFFQDHLLITIIDSQIFNLLLLNQSFNLTVNFLFLVQLKLNYCYFYLFYIIFLIKSSYSYSLYSSPIKFMLRLLSQFCRLYFYFSLRYIC